jgi:hypothetical protein
MKCQIKPPAIAASPTLPAMTPTLSRVRPEFPLLASLAVQVEALWFGPHSLGDAALDTLPAPTA